jgi:hypothetical protein
LELAALRVVKRASSLANLGMGAGFVGFAKVLNLVRRELDSDTLPSKGNPSQENEMPLQENKNPLLK